MNLVEMRARVREDLHDTDPSAYQWTNDQVDGAIQRAVREYTQRAPIEKISDLATTADSVEMDITSLTDLASIESIEFPTDETPPHYQRFVFYAGRVFMRDPGDGTDARVKWLQKHTLAAGSTTIPEEHDEIIVLGATGYLAMSIAAHLVDKATIAGRYGTMSYRAWARERLDRYDDQLKGLARQRRVISRQLYTGGLDV